MIPLEPRFDEPNVHIESMLVDRSVRGFRIADAMMYAFLRNRTETSFSLHVLPENAAAIRASERVGGPSFRPLDSGTAIMPCSTRGELECAIGLRAAAIGGVGLYRR